MKPRISEVRRMIELLDAEHDSVDSLAREVLVTAWKLAAEREQWCLVADHPGAGTFVHGPLSSKVEVERAVKRGDIVSAGNGPASGRVMRMVNV